MATRTYLDYAGLKRVLAKLLPGARKIWHGTLAEWEALSATEKAKYDQAEVIDEYTGVPVVVDKVESGNLNPVTSNAVAALNLGIEKSTGFVAFSGKNNYAGPLDLKTNFSLEKGKWLVALKWLANDAEVKATAIIVRVGGLETKAVIRAHATTGIAVSCFAIAVVDITTDAAQPVTVTSIDLTGRINGDDNYWYVTCIKIG